jgi:Cu/Ag efflux protein CusF
MRSLLPALTLVAGLLFPPDIIAADYAAQPAAETKFAESGQAMAAGVVKKVDKDAGKVTITHEPTEKQGMPKMTMVYRVKDPSMLDRLKEGDRINFAAEQVNGAYTVTRIEPAK